MRLGVRSFVYGAAATVFASAFLLFQVQPLIGKMILPWFGGSPGVWTACMLFFQCLLLVGYLYSHLATRWLSPARQVLVTVALLAGAVALLPITPGRDWRPEDSQEPVWRILALLLRHVGLPGLLLASTAPLVQTWYAARLGRSPYRLYALSNAASLLALLSYPFLFEPAFASPQQGRLWSAAFVGFALLYAGLGVGAWWSGAGASAASADAEGAGAERIRASDWARWILLPALASVMLLAVTNYLCLDVAVIPFLWVVPLSLYLLSFILCFDRDAWYSRRAFGGAASIAILVACLGQHEDRVDPTVEAVFGDVDLIDALGRLPAELAVQLVILFLVCMICHGELARRRPGAGRLTAFYLAIATGGALGGVFVALGAPLLFSSYFELNLGLVASFVLAVSVVVAAARGRPGRRPWRRRLDLAAAGFGILVVAIAQGIRPPGEVIEARRGFYGVLEVKPIEDAAGRLGRSLVHGGVVHGIQFLDPDLAMTPTSYFHPRSGVGIALTRFPREEPLRVGVVGLGAGTLAAYGRRGDLFRFYEINPDVVELATKHFRFLDRSPATVELVLGDARLALEREPAQGFDVLVVDAFSGDAIPIHLLTREAFLEYRRHLKPRGLLAVNVTNAYLELEPVVERLREDLGMQIARIDDDEKRDFALGATWLLLSNDATLLDDEAIQAAASPLDTLDSRPIVWTDQRSDLFSVLK